MVDDMKDDMKEMKHEKQHRGIESTSKGTKKVTPWHDNLYIVAALFLVVIILLYAVLGERLEGGQWSKPLQPAYNLTNLTAPRNLTGFEQFKIALESTDTLAIVQDVTDLTANQSRIVFTCGAALAGSWGGLGRNISNLHMYVIEGDSCLYSSPTFVNETGKLYDERTRAQCVAEYTKVPYFYIKYGPSFSVFTNTTATIYIDENFKGRCAFGVSEERPQGEIRGVTSKELNTTYTDLTNAS
jgi:hypothetical protein